MGPRSGVGGPQALSSLPRRAAALRRCSLGVLCLAGVLATNLTAAPAGERIDDASVEEPAPALTSAARGGRIPAAGADVIAVRRGPLVVIPPDLPGTTELTFSFGDAGDPIVVGDWDGDGIDTLGVRRGNTFHLRNRNTSGPATVVVGYGRATDTPVVGDWDGDGIDTLGVRRGNVFYLRNRNTSGPATVVVAYGRASDTPVVGDWDGDGIDTLGVRRGNTFYLRNANRSGVADVVVPYGRTSDAPVVGDWDGDGTDTLGVRRGDSYYLRNANNRGRADRVVTTGRVDDDALVGLFRRPPDRLVLNGTGDVNLGPYSRLGSAVPYDAAFAGLRGLFLEDDLTVINLECTPSLIGRRVPKPFNFRCPPARLRTATVAGVDVASLANNHAVDFGLAAMRDGIGNVRRAGMDPVGAGRNLARATAPVVRDIGEWRVAVLAFAGLVEFSWQRAGPRRAGVSPGDLATMLDAIEAADRGADVVVVTIHWGIERTFAPTRGQVAQAHAMVDAGADVIFGHHPHRLQPLEIYRGRPIYYSLGNFVWPRQPGAAADTAVAQVVIEPDGRLRACLLAATIVAHGQPALDRPNRRC